MAVEDTPRPKKSLRENAAAIARYHAMAAAFTGCPELRLSLEPQDEAMLLAEAFDEIGRHYNVSVPPKAKAIIELMAVVTVVYQPKLTAIAARKSASNPRRPSQDPGAGSKPAPGGGGGIFRRAPAQPTQPAPGDVRVQIDPITREVVPLTGTPDAGQIDLTERAIDEALRQRPPNEWQ